MLVHADPQQYDGSEGQGAGPSSLPLAEQPVQAVVASLGRHALRLQQAFAASRWRTADLEDDDDFEDGDANAALTHDNKSAAAGAGQARVELPAASGAKKVPQPQAEGRDQDDGGRQPWCKGFLSYLVFFFCFAVISHYFSLFLSA